MEKNLSEHSEKSVRFFDLMMEGLKDHVDAETFWDAVDENAVFKFNYYFLICQRKWAN